VVAVTSEVEEGGREKEDEEPERERARCGGLPPVVEEVSCAVGEGGGMGGPGWEGERERRLSVCVLKGGLHPRREWPREKGEGTAAARLSSPSSLGRPPLPPLLALSRPPPAAAAAAAAADEEEEVEG
jgi:hypothetical protein